MQRPEDKTLAEGMSVKDYRTWTPEYKFKWWRRAAEFYCRRDPKKAHLAEDFGSFVVENLVRFPERGVNLKFQFYSFHVEMFGYRFFHAGKFTDMESDEAVRFKIALHYETQADWDRLANELHFEGYDRTLFLLAWEYGFTTDELVHLTGKSRSSLSQIFVYQDQCIRKHVGMPVKKRNRRKWAAAEYWASVKNDV